MDKTINKNWLVINNEMEEDSEGDTGMGEKCESCGSPLDEDNLCPVCDETGGVDQGEDLNDDDANSSY